MVFIGNTQNTVAYMLRHSDLFDELPDAYHDLFTFLDRVHFFIPGWEVDIIRSELFTDGFGFVVDYLAEILESQAQPRFFALLCSRLFDIGRHFDAVGRHP